MLLIQILRPTAHFLAYVTCSFASELSIAAKHCERLLTLGDLWLSNDLAIV